MFGERLAVIRIRQLVYARFPDGPAGGGEAFRNQPGAEVLSRRDCPNTRQLPLMRGARRDARAIEDLLTRPRGRRSHTPRWCATGAFSIGPRPGTGRGGGSPRSRIISGDSFRGWASSAPPLTAP